MSSFGLNQRQLDSMINSAVDNMKVHLESEYGNILIRQGRARDTATFSQVEQNMEAMCDAYKVIFSKAISKVIESNNKRIKEDIDNLLRKYKTY